MDRVQQMVARQKEREQMMQQKEQRSTNLSSTQKKKEEAAAKKIQAAVRMKFERDKYLKMKKQHMYRTQVARELLATEESYVAKLQQIVDIFVKPLRLANEKGKSILSDLEIRSVFMTVEVIVSINGELREKLRQRLSTWSPQQLIGDVFVKIADVFKIYTDYVSHFSESTKTLLECSKRKDFADFCVKGFAAMDDPLANLASYLVTPIQRIPRYELLLKDLLKHTWKEHPDYENLVQAVDFITKTAIHVNEKQKEAENIQKVISIQNLLYGKKVENLIDPHRRFVREGELKEVVKDNKAQARWFVLFNDIIVKCGLPKGSLAKKKDATLKLEFQAKIALIGGSVVNTGDEGDIKHSFQLVTSRDVIWISCESEEEKDSWMASINACTKALAHKTEMMDRQLTQIAKQKASAAKNLIDEKYTNLRVHGSLTGSLHEEDILDGVSFHSLSAQERLLLAEKAGEKVKKLLAEEKEKNELAKQKAADFKEQAGQKYKRGSVNGGAVESDGDQPKLRKFASLKRGGSIKGVPDEGDEEKEQEKTGEDAENLREFAKKRRDTLTDLRASDEGNSGNSSEESPRMRRFASLKREDYKKTDEAAATASGGSESPRLRKFAQRRESLRKDVDNPKVVEEAAKKATLSKDDKKDKKDKKKEKKDKKKRGSTFASLKKAGQEDAAKGGGGGGGESSPEGEVKLRRFASLKRESYRKSTDSSPPSSPGRTGAETSGGGDGGSPGEEPKMRRFAQKNELYKNLAAKEK